MPRLTISLFGALRVSLDGAPITDFATDRARALLVYLAVERDEPHRRDELAGLLWSGQPQRKARQNLRQTLLYLRQAIGDDQSDSPFLHVDRLSIQFDPDSDHWLDVTAFAELAETCRHHRHRRPEGCVPCMRRMAEMAELHQGEFLAQFFLSDSTAFEEWASLQREWFHRRVAEALFHLSRYHERRSEYAEAVVYAQRLTDLEPWHERAHRQLMRLLALGGQRSAALAHYKILRQVLAEELAAEPSPRTVALHDQIQAGAGLDAKAPFSKLPPPPTPFVGRDEELSDLVSRLADPDCRLLTLVGPGGIGKTRLAREVAAEYVGAFEDGVAFVHLASIDSPDALVLAVADALGFSFQGREDPARQLLDYVRQKDLLLVLDTMEHLLGGLDWLIDVLRSAPRVVMLVTSRERLNLREEWVYAVGGLTYPEAATGEGSLDGETWSIISSDAVELFQRRAEQVDRHFSLSAGNAAPVARICRLVAGMPLAIELAAASAHSRSCDEIERQIERNIDALSTSLRNVPDRQRSIRVTFDHSWHLLSDQERAVFKKVSVFRGGFRAQAAQAVVGAFVPTLSALVGKSLLARASDGRYRVHELLRQYAAEKLQEDREQLEDVQARHAAHYAAFLEAQEPALKGAHQREAISAIQAEIDNVRGGWDWAVDRLAGGLENGAAMDVVGRSLETLYVYCRMQGWYQEGTQRFARAAAALLPLERTVEDLTPDEQRLWGQLLARQGKCCEFTQHAHQAQQLFESSLAVFERLGARREMALPLHGLGYMAHLRGEYAEAEAYLGRSLDLYREHGDLWGMAVALGNLCLVSRRRGAFDEAKAQCQESLEIRRQIGDRQGIASAMNNLALVQCTLGEYAEAQDVLQASLKICKEVGYRVGIANALTHLGHAAFRLGDPEAAKRWMHEASSVYRQLGDTWGVAITLNNLGYIAMEQGDYANAERLCRDSVALYREVGVRAGLANTLVNLGQARYHQGQRDQAWETFREALEIAWEANAIPTVLKALPDLARLWADGGNAERALGLVAFALRQPAISQAVRERATNLFAEIAATLSEDEVTTIEAHARSRPLEEVVEQELHDLRGLI